MYLDFIGKDDIYDRIWYLVSIIILGSRIIILGSNLLLFLY